MTKSGTNRKKAAAFSLKLLCVRRRLELGEGYLFLRGLHLTVKLGSLLMRRKSSSHGEVLHTVKRFVEWASNSCQDLCFRVVDKA